MSSIKNSWWRIPLKFYVRLYVITLEWIERLGRMQQSTVTAPTTSATFCWKEPNRTQPCKFAATNIKSLHWLPTGNPFCQRCAVTRARDSPFDADGLQGEEERVKEREEGFLRQGLVTGLSVLFPLPFFFSIFSPLPIHMCVLWWRQCTVVATLRSYRWIRGDASKRGWKRWRKRKRRERKKPSHALAVFAYRDTTPAGDTCWPPPSYES